jgi:hypothetical protein
MYQGAVIDITFNLVSDSDIEISIVVKRFFYNLFIDMINTATCSVAQNDKTKISRSIFGIYNRDNDNE